MREWPPITAYWRNGAALILAVIKSARALASRARTSSRICSFGNYVAFTCGNWRGAPFIFRTTAPPLVYNTSVVIVTHSTMHPTRLHRILASPSSHAHTHTHLYTYSRTHYPLSWSFPLSPWLPQSGNAPIARHHRQALDFRYSVISEWWSRWQPK